ncbi:rhomboid family intramembrane serine protease [Vallitalea guaymasensis]|uniref:rhomboid family intramembrane serine protease n=1 Tax=Vallitalea guaymasensis TaxID=1185412 RepID=UPI000DE21C77|nr:rhomboid family intramembrane serine protease [Vallitalea guaymasensis]
MKFLNRLERKLGRFAIRNLMLYIVLCNAFVYIFMNFAPMQTTINLALIPQLIKQGEIWRLVTFVFFPPTTSMFFLVFVLYFYYMIGSTLEHEWGSFKFNIYYLLGVIGAIVGAFITDTPVFSSFYINLSLFLAFARLYPDYQILLFFIIPVKMKWLAWFNWAYFAYIILMGNSSARLAAIMALINFFIFFGKEIITGTRNTTTSYYRKKQYNAGLNSNKKAYVHKCTVCGRTELDDKNLEFRYCSKCHGYHEYCMDHLHDHEHIKENN